MTTEFKPLYISFDHERITIEELQNSNLGYLIANRAHSWLCSSWRNDGISDKGNPILSVKYVLAFHIQDLFQQNEINCNIMLADEPEIQRDELFLVFDNPDQAVFAALLCDK